jgi:hypothetical protein
VKGIGKKEKEIGKKGKAKRGRERDRKRGD